MGSPELALPTLRALINNPDIDIVAVYTQPPRAKNRGKLLTKTAVHQLAEENELCIFTPLNFKNKQDQEVFIGHQADLAIVIAYGLILPMSILNAPKRGCVNLHVSLLPRWRGSSPIQQAILHGDPQTGVSLMLMDEKMDHGPIYEKKSLDLNELSTQASVFDDLSILAADLLNEKLFNLLNGEIRAIPQPKKGVTLAPKISKTEGLIDWGQSVVIIDRQIRALNPWPGTYFESKNNQNLKIIAARPLLRHHEHQPGTWLSSRDYPLMIACSYGMLIIDVIQKSGSKPMPSNAFLRGYQANTTLINEEMM